MKSRFALMIQYHCSSFTALEITQYWMESKTLSEILHLNLKVLRTLNVFSTWGFSDFNFEKFHFRFLSSLVLDATSHSILQVQQKHMEHGTWHIYCMAHIRCGTYDMILPVSISLVFNYSFNICNHKTLNIHWGYNL